MDNLVFGKDVNHSWGYHGSSKDCCIWCGSGESENQVCPTRKAQVEREEKKANKFRQDLQNLYKKLDRKERKIIRELCSRLHENLLE